MRTVDAQATLPGSTTARLTCYFVDRIKIVRSPRSQSLTVRGARYAVLLNTTLGAGLRFMHGRAFLDAWGRATRLGSRCSTRRSTWRGGSA